VHAHAAEEGAQLRFIDDVGGKAHDQIGTSDAPEGDTPVLEVPKTHLEHNVMSSVTPEGHLCYWPFPGTLTAPKFVDVLQQLVAEASTKIIVGLDHVVGHLRRFWIET
jgi:hypothetical protein